MASQVVTSSLRTLEDITNTKAIVSTIVRETPSLNTELNNLQDPFSVAVIKYGCVVRHIPRTNSLTVSFFLGKYGIVSASVK